MRDSANIAFHDVKAGDYVIRMLGEIPMTLQVHSVDDAFIYVGGPPNVGWKFRRDNGAEVDEDLGWDGLTETGSYLIEFHQ